MVALNENFAFENPHSVEKNRVGDFFVNGAKTRQVNRLSAQQPRLEKAHGYDETASGMFFYGYRYYDAVTGRWPSRDPLEEDGGLNLYAMVGNDAVNAWDYLGLIELPDIFPRDPEEPNFAGTGDVHRNRHLQQICFIGDADEIADRIYQRLKNFSLFNGNSTGQTAYLNKETGVVTFSPPYIVRNGLRLVSPYDTITVVTSSNDSRRHVYAQTTGSHFLVGNRTWAVSVESNKVYGQVFTFAEEQFASNWFSILNWAAGFRGKGFSSEVETIWTDYLNNVTDAFVESGDIVKIGEVDYLTY